MFPIALVTSITLTGILIYLGAIIFAVLFYLKRNKEFFLFQGSSWHIKAFLIYIFGFSITKLINSGVESCFHVFFRTCQDYFIFLWTLSFSSRSEKNQDLLKLFLVISCFITVTYGLLQFIHLDIFQRQLDINRLSGFHKNPYSYSGQLIIFFFFLLTHLFFKFKNKVSYMSLYLLTLSSLFCILSASERAVILGILFGLVIYLLISTGNIKKGNIASLCTLLIAPIVLIFLFNKRIIKRIKNTMFPKKGAEPNVRFKLWKIALATWKKNIFFGFGYFPTVYHQGGDPFSLKILTHAHNVYLHILVINGIVGLIAFVNLFVNILIRLFKNLNHNKYAPCLISVIFAFFIEGIFEFFWGDSEVRYLLLYFCGFVLGQETREQGTSSSNSK